jgi:hypothetical protein
MTKLLLDSVKENMATLADKINMSNKVIEWINTGCSEDKLFPLHITAAIGSVDIFLMLIEYGANPNLLTSNKLSCLHFAA